MHKFIFGVFANGKLLFPIGKVVECSYDVAELIAALMSPAEAALQDGHHIGYDHAEDHRVS